MNRPDDAGTSRRGQRSTGAAPALLLVVLLCLPGGELFSGLPLSGMAEYGFGVLLVPILFQRALRRHLGRLLAACPRTSALLAAVALLAMTLKLASAAAVGDPRGLAACYRSPLAEPPPGGCEVSFENPLFRQGATRFDTRLDFGPDDWNLSFFNSLRFNFFEHPENYPRRDRLPLQVRWNGGLLAPGAARIEIEYSGQGVLTLGGARLELEAAYDRLRHVSVSLAAESQALRVDYAFDDGSLSSASSTGPYATFRLRALDRSGREVETFLGPLGAWATAGRAAAAAADLLVAGLGVALFLFHARRPWRDLAGWLLVGAAALAVPAFHDTQLPVNIAPSLFACALILLRLLGRRRVRDVPATWFASVLLALGALFPFYARLDRVELRTPGDDWLVYESFARSILEQRSLAGGEPVFFYQPLFRYWRFAERLLLGDGELWLAASGFAAINAAILLGLRRLTGPSAGARVVSTAAGLLLLCVSHASSGGLRFVMLGASEYPTWIVAPFALSSLFVSRTARAALRGAALVGLSALARLNHLPALLALFAAFALRTRQRPRRVAGAAAVLLGLLLLPLAHNLYYGRQPEALTRTRGRDQSLVLPPDRVLANAKTQATLVRQVRYSLLLFRPSWDWGLLWPAVHGLQLLYLVTVVVLVLSRRLGPVAALLAASPLLSLGVHLFYVANNYYPRHILAGHHLMGLVTALLASGTLTRGRGGRTSGDPAAAGTLLTELKRNLPLALSASAVCFLVLELGARALREPALYVASENPRLIFELNPAHREINSLGMRQDEVDRDRLADEFVIAAIGDSHTYSSSSERAEHSYPARLEAHVRALTGTAVTVLNFGVPGYNMAQELEVLEARALPMKPDLVILQYCINDEHVSNFVQPEHPRFNQLAHASVVLARVWTGLLYSGPGRTYLYPVLERRAPDLLLFLPGLVGTARGGDPDPRHEPHPPRTPDRVPARYHYMIGRENLERAVRRFGAILQRAGIPGLATGFIEAKDRALYEAAGLRVHSFDDVFRGLDMRDYGYDPSNTSGHFRESGSELIARSLARIVALNPALRAAGRRPGEPRSP